jgi:glutamine synthetase type III
MAFTISKLTKTFDLEISAKIIANMGAERVAYWISNPRFYSSASDLLMSGFTWNLTPEGHEYWSIQHGILNN